MQHVNTKILKENRNLRNELKELTSITKAWLHSSNKVNQCISEQNPTQKKKILGIDQLTEDTSSSGPKDPMFVKSLADNSKVSIIGSNKPKLSEAEDSTLSNHNMLKHPLPLLEKLTGAEPDSGPKTIKSILKSKFTFKAETLKGIIINEPSSALARGNKSSSASKTNSAPAGKLKNVKMEDDPPLAIVMKELNELKLQISKNKSSYFRNKNSQQCKRTNHRTCDHAEFMSSMNINQYYSGQGESSLRSKPSRPAIPFPSCIHCRYNDHKSDDCVYYPICEICGSYDHDTHGHNRIISLRRGIKPRNPQYVTKNCEPCGSNVHTKSDHNDIEWFRKREALQAKKVESFKASKTESSSALRSKTPTKRKSTSADAEDVAATGCLATIIWIKESTHVYDIIMKRADGYAYPVLRAYDCLEQYYVLMIVFRTILQRMDTPTLACVWFCPNFSAPAGRPFRCVKTKVYEWYWKRKDVTQGNWVEIGGKTRGFDQITNKDAIILYSLANGINIDYASIFWEDIIIKLNKKHREKVVPYTRFLSLLMMHKMKEGYGDGELTLYPTQPGAKPRHKKLSTSSKQPSVSSREATKGGSSKASTSSKTGHSKKRKESSSAMDSNPSQPPVSTHVDTGMHKEEQQATGGPTSLGVTTSFIVHSESALGCDALADSTAEAVPGLSAPSDFVPQQQGMNEGTKNTSYDHLFAGTDPYVLTDKTKSVSEGLETVLTQPTKGEGANSIARQVKEEEASNTIKLEDLAKLVSHVQPSFKDLDSPEDDRVIVVDDSDEDEERKRDEVHPTPNAETEDTLKKNKAEAEAALLKAQPFFPNVEQLNELLVKSLKIEFLNILSAHDFSSSLPTEPKDLPSKLNELTGEVKGLKKQVHELEIELPGDLKEIPTKLDDFIKNVASVQAKLKTSDALPSLLLNVTQALNKFAQVLDSASAKAGDQSVPSAGQADTMHANGEKNTNQATISQLFQRRAEKNAEKENLNNQQPKPTTPPATTIIPPGEHIKKYKGKKAMSSKDVEEVSTESDSNDETTHVHGSMVESSKKKELEKFDFVTESGEHVHLIEEHISAQKKIEEEAKAEASRHEGEMRKKELIDLIGPEVVNKYYNDKLQYDRYNDKMLNRRAKSRITNCDILTRKGPITLKVYREDDTSEIIPEFKANDLHLGEWREVVKACLNKKGKGWTSIYKQIQERIDYLCTTEAELGIDLDRSLSEQDPLDRLNDLANKKRKHADDIHDFFRANKRLKSSVQYKEPSMYVLKEPVPIPYPGPRLDDHARTFSSLLLVKIDKRKLNPLKHIKSLSSKGNRMSLEDLKVSSLQFETEEGLWKKLQSPDMTLNNISVLLNNTAYSVISIRRNRSTKKQITMAEPNEYISVTRKNFLSNDNEGRMVEKSFVEIQGTFLVKIRDNTFKGIIGENAFKHIDNFLKIVEPLKVKGLTQDRFRLSVFPISLAGATSEWFKKDCIGSVTTWEDLLEKFVQKFYQLSDDNEEMEADEGDDPDDIAEIFKIKGNLFYYETPLCKAFNDFNYLLKIDMDLFTFDIQGIKTYEGYELNNNMTGDLEEPWSDNGSDIDGFCNRGELPEMVRVGCMTYFQDHKWYDELVDGKLKLKSSFKNFHELDHDVLVKLEECWWKVNAHEVAPFTRWENYGQGPYANAKTKRAYDPYLDINCIFGRNYGANNTGNTQDNQELKKEHHDPSTYRVRRFEMIKYSFDADDEYVAIKEHECSDHSKTNIDTCQAYRELFCIMDEGWLVKKACDE
ncbi:hypothetical protein Tco_0517193 [Tanacetum coccineum]